MNPVPSKTRPVDRSSRGTTLLETLVGLGIIIFASSLLSSGLFQSLGVVNGWMDQVMATKDWRHAGSLFATDGLAAQSTDLASDAPAVSSMALMWTDKNGVSHTSVYSVSGNTLVRTKDGVSQTVARQLISASFSRSGRTVHFEIVVEKDHGGTDTMALDTYLRTPQ